MSTPQFFPAYPDERQGYAYAAQALLFFVLVIGILWFGTRLTASSSVSSGIWSVFSFMAVITLLIAFWKYQFPHFPEGLDFMGIGYERDLPVAIIAGVVLGFVFSARQSLVPLSISFSDVTTNFIFVKIFSPIVEEYFFRGFLTPSLSRFFDDFLDPGAASILAIVVGAAAFALFHQTDFMAHFVFGIIAGVLMYRLKSIAAPLALHFVVNWLSPT